jgi:hypothetical protein
MVGSGTYVERRAYFEGDTSAPSRIYRERSPLRYTFHIALNDAMILPYDAHPGQMQFSERTTVGAPGGV